MFELPPWKKHEKPVEMLRRFTIELEHAGRTFLVHNGRQMEKVTVSTKMVGHKFGEFSHTRKIHWPKVEKKYGRYGNMAGKKKK